MFGKKIKKFWRKLGPGLITGASDDEPSAIATYSIAGAKFGYIMLWVAVFALPLMIAIQEMSARIGRVSAKGLAGNIKKHYPRWLLFFIAVLIVGANTVNIGADMSGMSQALAMIAPFPEKITAVIMTLAILAITIFLSYKKILMIFKWLALSLFAYILATLFIKQDWLQIIYHTFIPQFVWSRDFFIVLMAFMGTTISPYLFFWQANQEIEEKIIEQCKPGRICHLQPATQEELSTLKEDTRIGMSFSNVITFFIIALTASTLFRAGNFQIETLQDAAEALKPLAGEYAYLLFTLGIISSGFLAIPVLAGSAAYVVAEVFGWTEGLNKSFMKAKGFYGIVITSTVVGLLIPILGFHPIKALFYTSILYGIIAPILIFMVIHMANNPKIMGRHTNSRILNVFGYITFLIMLFFAILIPFFL